LIRWLRQVLCELGSIYMTSVSQGKFSKL
jgi:hypothetical protein